MFIVLSLLLVLSLERVGRWTDRVGESCPTQTIAYLFCYAYILINNLRRIYSSTHRNGDIYYSLRGASFEPVMQVDILLQVSVRATLCVQLSGML